MSVRIWCVGLHLGCQPGLHWLGGYVLDRLGFMSVGMCSVGWNVICRLGFVSVPM